MKTKIENTDNALKQVFDGFEVQPSKDLWAKVNARNVELGNVSSKSIYSHIALYAAAAIVVVTAALYLYSNFNNTSENIVNEAIETIENNIVDSPIKNITDTPELDSQPIIDNDKEEAIVTTDKKDIKKQINKTPIIEDSSSDEEHIEVVVLEKKKKVAIELQNNRDTVINKENEKKNEIANYIELEHDTNRTITNIDTFKVVYGENPVVCFGEDATLFVEEGFKYRWNTGDVQNKIIVSPVERSVYTVTITNNKGLTTTHEFTVNVDNTCSALYIPSAFTPNFDGHNDVFKAEGRGIKNMHMVVYNKLGQTVFESNNIDNAWDGSYKGEMPSETYIYHVDYTDAKGVSHIKTGQVTLIR